MIQNNNSFLHFGLNTALIKALKKMQYIKPSPIQQLCIPYLLMGKDVLGMAQTGSGKTAAFALPLLNNILVQLKCPQILVLTPTRELAIQVSKSFSEFAQYMMNIKVLALYGGQRYEIQLKILKTGPQVIVGTPGRLLDHLNRGTLNLSNLRSLVLDEADEMLRMGFIEDVENIMLKIPKKHQTALFSATMPRAIKMIAQKFMVFPKEIQIQSNILTQPNIKQSYWIVCGRKTDGLIRFLESEDFSATIIFVRTKSATLEISEALERHGYNSAALNGDMNQNIREQTLERLKDGRLDILIATDVAARGLDVDRISLVINYDIPMDAESYIHRIGRTGRAGRMGCALLFVEYRERRLLKNIERIIKQPIRKVELPNSQLLSQCRINKFYKKLLIELESKDLDQYCALLKKINEKNKFDIDILSAALLKMAQGGRPLIVTENPTNNRKIFLKQNIKKKYNKTKIYHTKSSMCLYRIDVGHNDGVEVRHIVGAIANEGRISSYNIGNVKIYPKYSTLELSQNLPKDIFKNLSHTRILNKPINMILYHNK
ncbi:ATP-dependent RNA helicase DeaD [Buchnera aphidicola (Takecallis arundicolens)]|uniref:DEAD/DEAH box helicase n=1 Tax=Buchnera aphidicola TaxID=9 RepID=UPI003464851E